MTSCSSPSRSASSAPMAEPLVRIALIVAGAALVVLLLAVIVAAIRQIDSGTRR